jgi:hypothetical protein
MGSRHCGPIGGNPSGPVGRPRQTFPAGGYRASMSGYGSFEQSPYVLIGTVEQMIQDLQARRERWGISYFVIHEPYLDAFAPVVARLAGT